MMEISELELEQPTYAEIEKSYNDLAEKGPLTFDDFLALFKEQSSANLFQLNS